MRGGYGTLDEVLDWTPQRIAAAAAADAAVRRRDLGTHIRAMRLAHAADGKAVEAALKDLEN